MEKIYSMAFEENRLKTFKNWPFKNNANCSMQKMAEAGFYSIADTEGAEPDAVQCFLCDKQMDGWDKADDPWIEHINHSKKCEFAKLKLIERDLTMHQFLNFVQHLKKNLNKSTEKHITQLNNHFDNELRNFQKLMKSKFKVKM